MKNSNDSKHSCNDAAPRIYKTRLPPKETKQLPKERWAMASGLAEAAFTLILKDNRRDRVTGKVSNTFTIESGKISFLVKE